MNPRTIEAEFKKLRPEKQAFVSALKAVMATREGRKVICEVLAMSKLFHPGFDRNLPEATFYNEGRREVGLEISYYATMYCKNEFRLMEDEAIEEQERIKDDADE